MKLVRLTKCPLCGENFAPGLDAEQSHLSQRHRETYEKLTLLAEQLRAARNTVDHTERLYASLYPKFETKTHAVKVEHKAETKKARLREVAW